MPDAERVLVIIPAAGSGTRFGGDGPKQFLPLGGKPLMQRVIERFLFDAVVTRVVVPVADMLLDAVKSSPGQRLPFVPRRARRPSHLPTPPHAPVALRSL